MRAEESEGWKSDGEMRVITGRLSAVEPQESPCTELQLLRLDAGLPLAGLSRLWLKKFRASTYDTVP